MDSFGQHRSTWFDLFFVGFIFFIVTTVPITIILVGCQFSLLAFFVMRSLKPSNFEIPTYHWEVSNFVLKSEPKQHQEMRLEELNHLLKMCEEKATFDFKDQCNHCNDNRNRRYRMMMCTFIRELPGLSYDDNGRSLQSSWKTTKVNEPSETTSPILWFAIYGCDPRRASVHPTAGTGTDIASPGQRMRNVWARDNFAEKCY